MPQICRPGDSNAGGALWRETCDIAKRDGGRDGLPCAGARSGRDPAAHWRLGPDRGVCAASGVLPFGALWINFGGAASDPSVRVTMAHEARSALPSVSNVRLTSAEGLDDRRDNNQPGGNVSTMSRPSVVHIVADEGGEPSSTLYGLCARVLLVVVYPSRIFAPWSACRRARATAIILS